MKLAIVGTTLQFFNVHKSHGFFFFFGLMKFVKMQLVSCY